MKRKSFKNMECSIARALEVVGEWWSLLIVRDALSGVRRFEDFLARLGVARNVLASRLAKLVSQGVLARRRYQDAPPRFEYVLTEKGLALHSVIVVLMTWGDRWAARRGPPVVLVFEDTGERIEPVLTDARTGRRVEPRATRARPGPGASKKLRERFRRLDEARRSRAGRGSAGRAAR
ncbi:helix-turn-helix transcriptional regulator [bacterium]|nr:helix-turn-helix transcriptional regulator [bacterium]